MNTLAETPPFDAAAADDKLKRMEKELAELKEESQGIEQKANEQIAELNSEIRDLQANRHTVEEEGFFEKDKAKLQKQLGDFDKQIEKRKKEIEKINTSTAEKTEKLGQKIGRLESAYGEEAQGLLPALFEGVCLSYKKWRAIECLSFGTLREQVDKFLEINDRAVQTRGRYATALSRVKASQDIPEGAIVEMERKIVERYGLPSNPRKYSESFITDRLREFRYTLIDLEQTYSPKSERR